MNQLGPTLWELLMLKIHTCFRFFVVSVTLAWWLALRFLISWACVCWAVRCRRWKAKIFSLFTIWRREQSTSILRCVCHFFALWCNVPPSAFRCTIIGNKKRHFETQAFKNQIQCNLTSTKDFWVILRFFFIDVYVFFFF